MNWFTGLLVYVIAWWIVFLAVLPWGSRPPENPEPGHAPSAPERPMLWRKAAVTTVLAAGVTFIVYLAVVQEWVSFHPASRMP